MINQDSQNCKVNKSFLVDTQNEFKNQEPSQGINLATAKQQNESRVEIAANMFETQLSDANSDKNLNK